MKILEIHMKNFGKFTDKIVRFHEGVNIMYGRNESGKSTTHAFIRAMLFGLERSRGRAAKNDAYSLRRPWENPGCFAGTMRFESGGKIFRLERSFSSHEKTASLVCETDGEELSVENGDLGVLMEGMNESAYRNTFMIGQLGAATEDGMARELQRFMGNLQNAGDAGIDINRACTSLDEKRRRAEAAKKKLEAEAADRVREQETQIAYVCREAERLEAEKRQRQEELHRLVQTRQNLERRVTRAANQGASERRMHHKGAIAAILIAIAALMCSVLLPWIRIKYIAALVCALAALALARVFLRNPGEEDKPMAGRESSEETERIYREEQKQKGHLEHICSELREKQTILENLQENQEELSGESEDAARAQQEIAALRMAADMIKEASKDMYGRWEGRLNRRVSEIMGEITDGRYTSIFLDEDLNIRINTPTKLLGLWQVSKGTMEQIYFALRMAAGEIFTGGEEVPVILDETFAMYDDERLERTLRWLYRNKKQVILFTCQDREARTLERICEERV